MAPRQPIASRYRIIGARWRLCDRWCKITA
jgi:hypothetical protein